MKITLLQTDIEWLNPVKNRQNASKMIDETTSSDLIILPEMFTTGFCTSPKGIAEKADTETLEWMQTMAKNKNTAIAGSVAVEQNKKYYNRFYFVKPNGTYLTYDKHHLFTFGGEHNEYQPGEDRVIVNHAGFRILLQICYDLRFPVFSRNKEDYDMIIYVASWPTSRLYAWNTLLKARAIENLSYVVGVNRVGADPTNQYNGGTVLIDYLGQIISEAEIGKEDIVSGEISVEKLQEFRKSFPALLDADQFTINYIDEREITNFG